MAREGRGRAYWVFKKKKTDRLPARSHDVCYRSGAAVLHDDLRTKAKNRCRLYTFLFEHTKPLELQWRPRTTKVWDLVGETTVQKDIFAYTKGQLHREGIWVGWWEKGQKISPHHFVHGSLEVRERCHRDDRFAFLRYVVPQCHLFVAVCGLLS